jgi:hypothetical protein
MVFNHFQLYMDIDRDLTNALRSSCNSSCFVAYTVPSDSAPIINDPTSPMTENMRVTLSSKLKQIFKEMEVLSK